jgi:hypothetical protein
MNTNTDESLKEDSNPLFSFDARVWAASFMEHDRKYKIASDEETMVTWFANALMRGYDEHANEKRLRQMICPHCGEDTDKVYVPESAWFQEFWVLFPRKVARKAAEKAWKKVATSEAVKDAIMAGLERQLPALRPKDRQFVPHAATWLNQERWNDESEGGLRPGGQPRVIECNKCGDTGTIYLGTFTPQAGSTVNQFKRCSCPRGQIPGLMVGTFSLETGELISNEKPQVEV